MRAKLIFVLLFPIVAFGQCDPYYNGTLSVQVFGDTVILHNDTAIRNCGATYEMKAAFVGDTLIWLQSDTGPSFACVCTFNLSVMLDSVKSGYYIAKVYYTQFYGWPPPYDDTCFVGSIPFAVTDQNFYLSAHKSEEAQSPCFPIGTGVNQKAKAGSLFIHPNPASNFISVEISGIAGNNNLSIVNTEGHRLITRRITAPKTQLDISALPAGVYFVRVTGERTVQVGKFVKR
jgi:hypothetical protein